jgi:translocator protein
MSATIKYIISIVICLAIGGVSGALSSEPITSWYLTLNKPSWNPPNYLFGPVWTTLYIMMAIALARIWSSPSGELRNTAIWVFAIQLFLNFWWSIIFFNFKMMGWALVEIVAMWLAIATTIYYFSKIDKTAAFLLVPYLLWVSFATFLNFTLWRLN